MQYLYLPGFSSKNINELESFEKYFQSKGLDILTHKWNQWRENGDKLDIQAETSIILENVANSNLITLIAKSYGTLVGSQLTEKLNFKRVFLMGLPFIDLTEEERESYDNYKSNITVFQRKNDLHGSIEQAKSMISPERAKFIALDGNTHQYDIPKLVFNEIENGI